VSVISSFVGVAVLSSEEGAVLDDVLLPAGVLDGMPPSDSVTANGSKVTVAEVVATMLVVELAPVELPPVDEPPDVLPAGEVVVAETLAWSVKVVPSSGPDPALGSPAADVEPV
jgi:hypothetical protein